MNGFVVITLSIEMFVSCLYTFEMRQHLIVLFFLSLILSLNSLGKVRTKVGACQYKKGTSSILIVFIEGAFSYQSHLLSDYTDLGFLKFKKKYQKNKKMSLLKTFLLNLNHDLFRHSLLYVPQGNVRKIQHCIKKHYDRSKHLKLKLIGISWGASSAMRLLKKLDFNLFNKVSLLTIDPVSRGVRVLKNLFTKRSNPVMNFPHHLLSSWLNFYQKDDSKTLIFGQKGNSYNEAIPNIKVLTGKNGHVTILKSIFELPYLKYLNIFFNEN